MPDPRSILVHLGLPEAGAGPLARFVSANRAALSERLDLVMPRHMAEPARAAAHFARHGNALALADLVEALDAAVILRLSGDGRDLLLCADALSGPVPGGPDVPGLEAVPVLAAMVAGFLAERFPRSELQVVFLADPAWMRRAWVHGLVTRRLCLGLGAFGRRLADTVPEAAVAGAAAAVAEAAPLAECIALSLAHAERHPLGPGGAVLELRDQRAASWPSLVPVPPAAEPDAALLAALLRLNACGLPDPRVRREKRALLDASGLVPWARLPSPSEAA